jgi:hypothetical protein
MFHPSLELFLGALVFGAGVKISWALLDFLGGIIGSGRKNP